MKGNYEIISNEEIERQEKLLKLADLMIEDIRKEKEYWRKLRKRYEKELGISSEIEGEGWTIPETQYKEMQELWKKIGAQEKEIEYLKKGEKSEEDWWKEELKYKEWWKTILFELSKIPSAIFQQKILEAKKELEELKAEQEKTDYLKSLALYSGSKSGNKTLLYGLLGLGAIVILALLLGKKK